MSKRNLPDDALLVAAARSLQMVAKITGANVSVGNAPPEFLAAMATLPNALAETRSYGGSEWDAVDLDGIAVTAYSPHRKVAP